MPGFPLQTLAKKIHFPGEDLTLIIDLSYTVPVLFYKKGLFSQFSERFDGTGDAKQE